MELFRNTSFSFHDGFPSVLLRHFFFLIWAFLHAPTFPFLCPLPDLPVPPATGCALCREVQSMSQIASLPARAHFPSPPMSLPQLPRQASFFLDSLFLYITPHPILPLSLVLKLAVHLIFPFPVPVPSSKFSSLLDLRKQVCFLKFMYYVLNTYLHTYIHT